MDCLPEALPTYYEYFRCPTDKLVFRVPWNELKFDKIWGMDTFICPKCQRKMWTGAASKKDYTSALIQSLSVKVEELQRKVAELEFSPSGGPEFLKLVEEAREAGDFH